MRPDSYFAALQAHELLDAEGERALAREIEQREIEHFRTLLCDRRAIRVVAAAIETRLPADAPVLEALRALARTARQPGASPAAWRRRGRALARELRAADVRREALRAGDAAARAAFARDPRASGYLARVARARAAQERAKHRFVNANLRLVVAMARRHEQSGLPLDDLIQEGNLGLMRAVDGFDYRRGFRFSTYAAWWIRHHLNRALSDKARLVRLPVHAFESAQRLSRLIEERAGSGAEVPSELELGQELGLSQRAMSELLGPATRQPVSLDAGIGGGDQTLHETLAPDEPRDPEETLDVPRRARELEHLMRVLTPREVDILRCRFGLEGGKELTLREVGARYELSRERIRQLQQAAIAKLREHSGIDRWPDPTCGTAAA